MPTEYRVNVYGIGGKSVVMMPTPLSHPLREHGNIARQVFNGVNYGIKRNRGLPYQHFRPGKTSVRAELGMRESVSSLSFC